ncbi:HNH endonuclease signature motif containing protein [Flavobacterium algicola]|uniref:HNH endonuclease signature motif containing protein n=1 Tax=Flavobacterium algicola TaxID=556529 RepID=UPI001EFC9D3B|nr:HNH endonuclease signature motif containing protein [Flavobacterium algicola]MCG9792502.1 HNH endonuclease [Flavobacterium algicola]
MAKKPEKIQRSWVPQRRAFERENNNQEFYNSWPWRKFAKRFKANNPLCVKCLEKDLVVPVKVVDHITPIKAGGAKLDESNCQSLCASCHNSKSSGESRGYGVKSR